MLGSTEWGEAHADELHRHAVAYINSDGNGRGYLSMGGSHSLEKFINGVARDIQDPEKKIPVWKRDQLKAIADARTPEDRKEARDRADLRINALGSGSDWTVFLDHLGIASLDLAMATKMAAGIYHSIYDDFYWYTHFSDTDFSYGRALSQTAGTAVMRLADSDLLPYDFTGLADTIHPISTNYRNFCRPNRTTLLSATKKSKKGSLPPSPTPKKHRCRLRPKRCRRI